MTTPKQLRSRVQCIFARRCLVYLVFFVCSCCLSYYEPINHLPTSSHDPPSLVSSFRIPKVEKPRSHLYIPFRSIIELTTVSYLRPNPILPNCYQTPHLGNILRSSPQHPEVLRSNTEPNFTWPIVTLSFRYFYEPLHPLKHRPSA